ncbi:growth arrest-specific protein 1 [Nasonia vitripennis]|uniref:GDNF/GAS1 domain-containing protein n=1 Tax=Nasonia vitripennis TaxID=7425 RepID=A0A7M7QBI5_NASVI|nr:growth arrest-specific protein 1 [Nasonia vitripennis]
MSCRCHSSTLLLTLLLPLLLPLMLAAAGRTSGSSKAALPISMVQSNSSETALLVEEQQPLENATVSCDDARLRCAYRTGCGRALQHYLTLCASSLQGGVNDCPEICQHALIGLMSTDEGKELMMCDCAENDVMCKFSKQRAEICRASVTATMNRTRVSCRVATWICIADTLCSTALQYYNENCKRMFHGKKCTKRCRNSINILRRQEKAEKLNTCYCDGIEEYDCTAIHRNMDELCFNKPAQHNYREQQLGAAGGAASGGGGKGTGYRNEDPRRDRLPANAAVRRESTSWRILLLGLVLLLHSLLGREE